MVFFTLVLTLLIGNVMPATISSSALKTELVPVKGASVVSEHVVWSPDRRLSWDDFKASPDTLNSHHAMTAANLAVDAKCNGSKFDYKVRCVFLPTESWSKNKKSSKLLRHEQMHFDLTEVHARLLRKNLQELGSSCSNVQSKLNETVSAGFAAWKAEQRKFDKTSNHGLDTDAMQVWATDIDLRLKQLEMYK